MKVRKIPMRTCLITRERCEKKDLIRIVRTPEGKVQIDETGKLNGRGCYLKKDPAVILKAQKSKALSRALEVEVEDSIYEELIHMVE